MSKTIRKIISERSLSLIFITAKDELQNDFVAYLLLNDNMLEKFEKDYQEKEVILNHYGKVIFSKFGLECDEETEKIVINMCKEKYFQS